MDCGGTSGCSGRFGCDFALRDPGPCGSPCGIVGLSLRRRSTRCQARSNSTHSGHHSDNRLLLHFPRHDDGIGYIAIIYPMGKESVLPLRFPLPDRLSNDTKLEPRRPGASGTQPKPAQDCDESRKAQYPAGGHEPPPPSENQTGCQSNGTNRGKPESAEEEDPGPRLRGRVGRIKCHWREDRPREDEEGARGTEGE
jgi:hypothetical protein